MFSNTNKFQYATSTGSGGGLNISFPQEQTVPAALPKWPFDDKKMSWALASEKGGIEILELWNKYGLTGQKVKVAVLDSGIDTTITDISGAVNDKDADIKCFLPGEPVGDDIGHGTTCASIIASRGDNLYGAAPQCNLIIGKIESKRTGKTSATILAALKWACEERNADIISMSFSVPCTTEAPSLNDDIEIANYIKMMHEVHNKFFIAAIGNLGEDAKDFFAFPANYDGCLSVGATGDDKLIWDGSSWNKKLSFVVPGSKLKGYDLSKTVSTLEPATSYACPLAAGVFANLLSYFKSTGNSFSAKDIISRLKYDLPDEENPFKYGNGILNPVQSFLNIK